MVQVGKRVRDQDCGEAREESFSDDIWAGLRRVKPSGFNPRSVLGRPVWPSAGVRIGPGWAGQRVAPGQAARGRPSYRRGRRPRPGGRCRRRRLRAPTGRRARVLG